MIQSLGLAINQKFLSNIKFLGGAYLLALQSWRELITKPFYFSLMVDQVYQLGIRSFGLVFVTAISTGMVMALQFGSGLEKFGGTLYVPKVVSLSIVKELGPVFTSLILAGRVGAGITSEIGSMAVTQQLDAIRALGTSPLKKIVIPRILGLLISLPLLTVIANTIGIIGGLLVGVTELGLDAQFYYEKIFSTITMYDYLTGLIKTLFFAFFISLSGCYFGMTVRGGTRGVGIATTQSVVTSSVLIVVSDYFLSKLFWILDKWL